MAGARKHWPIYATVWFNGLATVAALIVVVLATQFRADGKTPTSTGEVIVCVLAGYWLFVFPRMRKSQAPPPASPANPARKA